MTRVQIIFWRVVALAILAAGAYATFVRFTQGLGAVHQPQRQVPLGLWIGFDVLCGVGLAAGGFTHHGRGATSSTSSSFEPIVRPTILTAFLGYLLVIIGLMFDLGRPWNIWHAIVLWNPHSVMFEVAWCVMLYTHRAGARVLAGRVRAAQAGRAAEASLQAIVVPLVGAGRHPLDAAPVLARHPVPDRARQAAPAVVLAAAAGPLLAFGDRGRAGDGDLRVAA